MTSRIGTRGPGGSRAGSFILLTILIITFAAAIVLLPSCGRSGGRSSASGPTANTVPVPAPVPNHPQAKTEKSVSQTPPVSITEEPKAQTPEEPPAGKTPDDPNTITLTLKQGEIGSGKIALTFDAGASSKPTPALLSVLEDKGVHATFFLTGKWVEQNPALVKRIVADGNEVGNHTYSHPDLRKLTDDEIREQLRKTEDLVQSAANVSTKPYFRPPYGAFDDRVLQIAAEEGYRCVYWSADSWDGFKKGIQAPEIEQRVLDRAKGGAIVLMHCGSWPTVDAVPRIIDELRSRGFELVKISDL